MAGMNVIIKWSLSVCGSGRAGGAEMSLFKRVVAWGKKTVQVPGGFGSDGPDPTT